MNYPTHCCSSRTPYSSGCTDTPKYKGHIPAAFPRIHKGVLHENLGEWAVSQCNGCIYSFRGWLCFAGSLQKKWKQYVREVCKYGAIYSLQIHRVLPTPNIKDSLCQILHMLLSASPSLFPEKKISYINQRANI